MPSKLSKEDHDEARAIFELADKEGGGKVSAKEVGHMLRSLGHNPSEQDLEKLLLGKGEDITFDKFIDMLGDGSMKDIDNEEELRVAFTVFDREGQVV